MNQIMISSGSGFIGHFLLSRNKLTGERQVHKIGYCCLKVPSCGLMDEEQPLGCTIVHRTGLVIMYIERFIIVRVFFPLIIA